MKLIFAGTPQVAVPSLEELLRAGFTVCAVLTREDAPVGRKKVLTPSPVAAAAERLGIPVIKGNRIDVRVIDLIASYTPDVAAIVAYGGIVPGKALDLPIHGWVNLHFSLLPSWRGAAPVQHALMSGDDITGASTFLLEEGLDTGPVFGSVTETVLPTDTSGVLLERLSHSGAVLLAQTLDAIGQGRAHPVTQQGAVSLAPKLTLEDGRIRWQEPAVAVRRRINGVTPEPGAWTLLDGERVKLGPVTPRPEITELRPGAVETSGRRVVVGTGSGAVELGLIQPSGRRMMDAADWIRGAANQELIFT
ncbi:methionyl-tRNA formyltransferase [Arthrobacter sp. H5]|uniref:methionyl-tRNA formyltransferase n=1 Tax=Arthrobacter sp. H5 TaxID=1267973 RepID=UPI000488EA14|nr:methionyl-tRNA formyltransferase [Arthrobacter sp. H5]